MSAIWRWLTRWPHLPDLGDINDGVQHRRTVRFDGRLYELADVKRYSGDDHSQVKLTFIPGGPLPPLQAADGDRS